MIFRTYYLGCLAHASYLIGGENGEAVVVDPRRDVEEYIADAEAAGLTIRHVIETHLHADFVSGHVELARRAGATIYIGGAANAGFAHRAARDGDSIDIGGVLLRFLETPGHTPESVCVLVESPDEPIRALTGDTLFIGDVGRPDLAGASGYTADQMARQLYRSLRDKILHLPDSTEIWPAHGAGSACGKSLSDERTSTLAIQKMVNPALRLAVIGDEEGFVRLATEGLTTAPGYFSHDARKNREGAVGVDEVIAGARPITPAGVEELAEEGVIVLDTRSVADFGKAHIPGALHVQLDGKFAPWVGVVIDPEESIVVASYAGKQTEVITRLARIGYERIVGWVDDGIEGWRTSGGEIASLPQMSPADLRAEMDVGRLKLVDVRTVGEWEAGHIDGSLNIPLDRLRHRIDELPTGRIAIMCGTGYRSSVACSILQRAGFRDVLNVGGGWESFSTAAT